MTTTYFIFKKQKYFSFLNEGLSSFYGITKPTDYLNEDLSDLCLDCEMCCEGKNEQYAKSWHNRANLWQYLENQNIAV